MKLFSLSVMSTLIAMGLASAEVKAEASLHITGVNLGYGTQEYESRDGERWDAGDGFKYDIWYRYMLTSHWGVELSYGQGTGGAYSAMFDILSDVRELEYSNYRAALYGQYNFSRGNSVYAKAGMAFSDITYDLDDSRIKEDAEGFFGAVGWQHRFHSGFGLGVEYQYTDLKQLEVQSINIAFSWQF